MSDRPPSDPDAGALGRAPSRAPGARSSTDPLAFRHVRHRSCLGRSNDSAERARRGRKTTTISGGVVVPRDLKVGNKVRVKGYFTLISSGGFNTSNGLVEYASHETLQKASAK